MNAKETFADIVRGRVAAIESSGTTAIGSLIDATADRLIRFAISITGHQHDAEDAVQTVLTRIASNPRGLIDADQPWSYLLSSVRFESLSVIRRSRRFPLLQSLADLVTWTPVDQLQHQETRQEVWRSLRRLPAEQAEVVVLKIWEQMTLAEIAVITDQSIDTVASRYRYAMTKMHRMLAPMVLSQDGESRDGEVDDVSALEPSSRNQRDHAITETERRR